MNRRLNLLDYAAGSILRRYSAHLPVAAVFIIVVFLAASVILTLSSLKKEAANILAAAPELTVQEMSGGRQTPIAVDIAEKIRSVTGVESARPRIWGYLYEPYAGVNLTLWGVDEITGEKMFSGDFSFREGGFYKPGERWKIVVGEKVPQALNLKGRKNLTFTDGQGKLKSFEIAGVFSSVSSMLTADLVIMPEKDLREFFHMDKGLATDIAVTVKNPAEIPMAAVKISSLCPSCRVISRTWMQRAYEAVFNFRGGLVLLLWMGCLVSFLILLWNKGAVLSGLEKRELGILKAAGWSFEDILELKIMEGAMISGASFTGGFAAACIHVYGFDAVLFRPVLFGWSVLFPSMNLVPVFSFGPLFLILILTVLPYMAVSLLSAWKSATMDIGELIRGEDG